MPEDEHSPASGDPQRGGGGNAPEAGGHYGGAAEPISPAGHRGAEDFNAEVLARLAKLEDAFNQQTARINALERRLGLVKYQSKPRESVQGETSVSNDPSHVEDATRGARQRPDPGAQETARQAHEETTTPFGTPRFGAWQQEPGAGASGAGGTGANANSTGASETEASGVQSARRDLEQLIGGSLFNWLGIIAVTLTVGFFLKYAFDNEWIGQGGQVLIGGAAGVGILFAAERLRARGYRSYAYVLSGGGILILYLTVWAARVAYGLIEVLPAFLLMVAVTTTAVLLAARHHAYAIAVLGIIGGFMTPALLSTGVDNQLALFGYVALLDAGVLALAYFKNWRSLNHMAFVATVFTFGIWQARYYEDWKLWRTLFFLTLFFLMFNALGVVYNVIKRRPARWFDITLIIANSTLFFLTSYGLLTKNYHAMLGSYALLWSAFYVILFYFTYQRHRADKLLALSYIGAASTFFMLAAAIQFDQHWVTIAWSMEALMLTWIGLRAESNPPRRVSLIIFSFATLRWFASDMFDFAYRAGQEFVPLLNRRAVSAAALIAAFGGAAWLYRREGEWVERKERETLSAILILAANVIALTLLTVDVNDYFNVRLQLAGVDDHSAYSAIENTRQFTLTVLWTFYALVALVVGIERRIPPLRYAALMWLAVTGVKLIVSDARFYDAAWHLPLVNQTFAAFAVYVAALWYAARLYARTDKMDEEERSVILAAITVAANVYAITALSLEATGYFKKLSRAGSLEGAETFDLRLAQGLSLSLVWTLYGGAMLLYGHQRANRLLRVMALVLLTATALKVFFLDLAVLERFYRIVSFLVLGAILLAVSFLYQQKQRAAKSEGG